MTNSNEKQLIFTTDIACDDRFDEEREHLRELFEYENAEDVPDVYVYDALNNAMSEELDEIKAMLDKTAPNGFVCVGSLGLWNKCPGVAFLAENANELIELIYSRSIEDIELYLDKNGLNATASHHDGRNYFMIRAITGKLNTAIEALKDHYKDTPEIIKRLFSKAQMITEIQF